MSPAITESEAPPPLKRINWSLHDHRASIAAESGTSTTCTTGTPATRKRATTAGPLQFSVVVVVVVVVVLTCAFNKGVCPSMPTGAPDYGHVPCGHGPKKSSRPSCLDVLPCRETPGVRLPGAPGTAPQKHHTTESESAIRAHKAVSATNARFPNSVVTYGNEHMSTKHEEKQRNPCLQQRIRIPTRNPAPAAQTG